MSEDILKYLVKYTQEEYEEQKSLTFVEIHTAAAANAAMAEHQHLDLVEEWRNQECQQTTAQKQKQRAHEKEAQIKAGLWNTNGTLKNPKASVFLPPST